VQVNGYSLLGDKADRHEMNYRSLDKLQTFRRLISDLLFVPLADVKIYCSNYFLLE